MYYMLSLNFATVDEEDDYRDYSAVRPSQGSVRT